jgi:hypothetical protein
LIRAPRGARALTIAALWLAPACATVAPVPELVALPGEAGRAGALLDRVRADAGARQRLRAEGRVELASRERSGRFREVILAERPASLRLETLNLLGHTQTLLVTDGREYAFFDGRTLERGPVTPEVLRERLGVDLAPADAVAVLLATPALPAGEPDAVFGQGDDRIVVVADARVRFAPAGDLAEVRVLEPSGEPRWIASYAGWREASGGRYPFDLVLEFPATDTRARLELSSVELNPELDPALFRLPPGTGE